MTLEDLIMRVMRAESGDPDTPSEVAFSVDEDEQVCVSVRGDHVQGLTGVTTNGDLEDALSYLLSRRRAEAEGEGEFRSPNRT